MLAHPARRPAMRLPAPVQPGTTAAQGWGLAAFWLLFPGFFFYHTLLGLGRIPALLGGYFTPMALALALPLMQQMRRQLITGRLRLLAIERLYLLYLFYLAGVILLNGAAGQGRHTLVNHLLCVLFMAELYAIFRLTDFAQPLARRLCWVSLAAMSAIVFSYAVDGVFYLAPLGQALNPDSLATYQGFSRSYALVLAVVVATLETRWLRLFWYAVGSATLFLNTARSEFVRSADARLIKAAPYMIEIISFCRFAEGSPDESSSVNFLLSSAFRRKISNCF